MPRRGAGRDDRAVPGARRDWVVLRGDPRARSEWPWPTPKDSLRASVVVRGVSRGIGARKARDKEKQSFKFKTPVPSAMPLNTHPPALVPKAWGHTTVIKRDKC